MALHVKIPFVCPSWLEYRSKSAILDNWEELLQETGFSPNNIKKVLGDQLDDNPLKEKRK